MSLLDRIRGRRRPAEPPTYSNSAVVDRIQREEGVDRETARKWFEEMLVFLDLCARSDTVISPPEPVDRAWHAFVLHTRDYEAYCKERFGRIIHHEPAGEPDPRAYRRAYEQRAAWGGSPDPGIWAVPAVIAASEVSDGGGDGGGGGFDFGGGDAGGGASCGGGGGGGG